MLKGYADVHVQFPIVQGLRARDMDVVTAQDRNQQEADDDELLNQAYLDERVMLSNDHDFLRIASQRSNAGETFAPIYFWPQQSRSIGEMIRRILREASTDDYERSCSQVFFL